MQHAAFEVININPAEFCEFRKIMAGEQFQIIEQGFIGLIQPVSLRELHGEAFGQCPREDSGRLHRL